MRLSGQRGNLPQHTDPAVSATERLREQAIREAEENAQHYARGGITDYPSTGRLAMLHGREAVIPLPSGLKSEDLGDMFKIIQEKLYEPNQNLDIAAATRLNAESQGQAVAQMDRMGMTMDDMMERLTIEMSKLSDTMERMVSETRNISTYTERTARGVA
jgi:hypothetical protein